MATPKNTNKPKTDKTPNNVSSKDRLTFIFYNFSNGGTKGIQNSE